MEGKYQKGEELLMTSRLLVTIVSSLRLITESSSKTLRTLALAAVVDISVPIVRASQLSCANI